MCYDESNLIEEFTIMPKILNVLLIEDNAGDAYMLKAMLADANGHMFKVDWAKSLTAGLNNLNTSEYDAVLIDLQLPDSSGMSTLARLNGEILSIPVLVLTDQEDDIIARKVIQSGAQDYLLKNRLSSDFLRQSIVYGIDRQRLVEKIRSESIRDELTHLYNRRGFLTLVKQQLKIVHRQNRPASLLFFDMDNLKEINDTVGHSHGDMAIAEIGQILKKLFRDSDIIARMGGDEFAVFALGADEPVATELASRFQDELDKKNSEKGRTYQIAVSIGIASYETQQKRDVKELLSMADALMYRHKNGRKNGETLGDSVSTQL